MIELRQYQTAGDRYRVYFGWDGPALIYRNESPHRRRLPRQPGSEDQLRLIARDVRLRRPSSSPADPQYGHPLFP